MAIDILDNPLTNEDHEQNSSGGWLSKLGHALMGGVDVLSHTGEAIHGIGKYAIDTFTADHNSVPFSVRAAVAAAEKPEDKLRTLRQFYPDAMPTPDGDFKFYDPELKKPMTLNDPGLSMGDIVNALPSIGEGAGATAGFVGGGALGGLATTPTVAGIPAGVIGGGMAGAGVGGAAGKELTRQGLEAIGKYLTGKETLDTRTGGDIASSALKTGGINAASAAIPFGYQGTKNYLAAKNLIPESGELYEKAAAAGYDPSLSQIGSDQGKKLEENILLKGSSGATDTAVNNQDVLTQKLAQFLQVPSTEPNDLANAFRAGQTATVGGQKKAASDLYDNVHFGDDIVPATDTKQGIADVYQKRGMQQNSTLNPAAQDQEYATGYGTATPDVTFVKPKGENLNPAYEFDSNLEHQMSRVMSGKASEQDLDILRKDITTALREKDLPYQKVEALKNLKSNLTSDLVQGSPDVATADKAARSAWFQYKDTQDKLQNLLGKEAGVTDGVDATQGLTEAQNLNRAKGLFSNKPTGSDTKASELSDLLSDDEKRTALASILTEDQTGTNFKNSLEAADQKYNLGRVGKYLLDDKDVPNFQELLDQSKGVPSLNGNPTPPPQRWDQAVYSALAKKPQQWTSDIVTNMAKRGQVPGNLPASPQGLEQSLITNPSILSPSAIAANSQEPAYKIPQDVINENQSKNSDIDLNKYLIKREAGPSDIDKYLIKRGTPAIVNSSTSFPNQPSPSSNIEPKTMPAPQATSQDVENYIASKNAPQPGQPSVPSTPSKATSQDVENYINQLNQNNKKTRDYSLSDDPAERLLSALRERESSNNYQNMKNPYGYVGAYQFGAQALEQVGLLKPGASRQGNVALQNPNNWTVPGGLQTFLSDPKLQDDAARNLIESNRDTLKQAGVIKDNTPESTQNGLLAAAHLGGASAAIKLFHNMNSPNIAMRGNQGIPDAFGTTPGKYFQMGARV